MKMDKTSDLETAVLDVRGLRCPLPVLKAKKRMRDMKKGARLWIETTDPLAAIDIPAFCQSDGHRLVDTEEGEGYQRYLLENQTRKS